jgi:hypothetical protein
MRSFIHTISHKDDPISCGRPDTCSGTADYRNMKTSVQWPKYRSERRPFPPGSASREAQLPAVSLLV